MKEPEDEINEDLFIEYQQDLEKLLDKYMSTLSPFDVSTHLIIGGISILMIYASSEEQGTLALKMCIQDGLDTYKELKKIKKQKEE